MATDAKLTDESSSSEILKSLTPAQHKQWRETGEITLEEKKAESPHAEKKNGEKKTEAESSPAAKVETAEEKAASAAGKTDVSRNKNAETRIKELLSENKRLESELEAARKAPVAAVAKIEEPAKPRRTDVDTKTGQPKYASDEEFESAYESYLTAKVTKDVETRHEKSQRELRIAEQNRILQEKWHNSLLLGMEAHEDFRKVCGMDEKNAFQNAELKKIKEGGALDRFCLDTPRGGDVLYYLASHPGEVERIQSIDSLDGIIEALADLKRKSLATKAAAKEEKKTDEEEKKPEVSKAPAPASSVGGKATAPRDEEEAAVEAGDFRRYAKAANDAEWRSKKKAS